MRKKILVVEDSESLGLLYEHELTEEGYAVSSARSVKEALSRLKADEPDLIILDIVMSGISGISVVYNFLEGRRRPRIILHSAYPEYRQNFKAWGADVCLTKCADLTELKEKVRELLGTE
jgi:DNA-binding response OmpR family regulator